MRLNTVLMLTNWKSYIKIVLNVVMRIWTHFCFHYTYVPDIAATNCGKVPLKKLIRLRFGIFALDESQTRTVVIRYDRLRTASTIHRSCCLFILFSLQFNNKALKSRCHRLNLRCRQTRCVHFKKWKFY